MQQCALGLSNFNIHGKLNVMNILLICIYSTSKLLKNINNYHTICSYFKISITYLLIKLCGYGEFASLIFVS